MTKTDLTKIKELLRDVVAGFVEQPNAIQIAHQTAPGSCYWMMRVAPVDDPKAIGKDGAHARAIATLVAAWGDAEGEAHTFRLLNNTERVAREPDKIRDVMEYDVGPRRELLSRALSELALDGFAIKTGPGAGVRDTLTFELAINVATDRDYALLTRPRGESGVAVVAALGTLFRAIARNDGVNIEISVRR